MYATATPAKLFQSPARSSTAPTYVHPGRLSVQAGPAEYNTVAGSGVVVCVWDPVSDVSGMCHFLLPEKGSAPAAPRFGDVGMAQLVEEVVRLGAQRARLRAGVYGGSAPPIASESGHLGDRNVTAALAFLRAASIPVVQREVGGAGGRKVVFRPQEGRAESVRLSGA